MPTIIRRSLPPKEERELTYYQAQVIKQAALIDYLSAMTDVEIPDETATEEEESYVEEI